MGASEVRSEKLAGWQKRLPELDIARVRRWCDQRVPDHALDEVRMECEIGPRRLTTVELCPPWRSGLGSEWTRSPIARLRYATRPAAGHCTGSTATGASTFMTGLRHRAEQQTSL
jgi:hypothetical protein